MIRMMRESWLLLLMAATTAHAAVETPAPSLICSDVPSRPVLEPSPSHEPTPTFFIRRNSVAPTRGDTAGPTQGPTMFPTGTPTGGPTSSPSLSYCDGDMLDHLSLVGPAGQEVIPILKNGNVFHRMAHAHPVGILAVPSGEGAVKAVKITVDDDWSVDMTEPFVYERTHLLSVPGSHTVSAQVVDFGTEYKGCFQDHGTRVFPHYISSTTGGWTASQCSEECGKRGFEYSASQWHAMCFCGDQEHFDTATPRGEHECNTPCRMDTTQKCGGGWRNSVYKIVLTPEGPECGSTFTTEYDVEGRTCEGMVPTLSLLTGPRGQIVKHVTDGVQTINMFDNPNGFKVRANANPEFVTFVKFTIDDEHVIEDDKFPYIADTAEILKEEGSHTVQVDSIKFEFEYKGCYVDQNPRSLPVWGSGNRYTPQTCATECLGRGYEYSGTQWYGYCFCGTQENFDTNVLSEERYCNRACTVDPSQICGGGWRNSVVHAKKVPQGPTCTVEINTIYQVEGQICDGLVPTVTMLEGGETPERIGKLTLNETTVNMMEELEGVILQADTPPELVDGIQFTVDASNGETFVFEDTEHPYRMDTLDGLRSIGIEGTHSIKIQALEHNITYLGCYLDNGARYFDHYLRDHVNNLDATGCATECRNAGFPYAGSQAGGYCFCGTAAEMAIYNAGEAELKRAETDCRSKCKNNQDQICGGGWRNSVFRIDLVDLGPSCDVELEVEYEVEEQICAGMIQAISLVNTTDNEVVQYLHSGRNVLNMRDFPDGVGVLVHSQPLFVPTIQLKMTESSGLYEPYSKILPEIPYADVELDALLALPGTHEILVEALGYEYVGCYRDHGQRMFGPVNGWIATIDAGWDVYQCLAECNKRGFPLSGSQWYGYCFCGTEEELAVSDMRPETECNTNCRGGDTSTICGGSWRNSVYRKIPVPPASQCGVELVTVYEDAGESVCEGMIPYLSLVSADTGEVIIEKVGKSSSSGSSGCAEGTVKVTPGVDDYHTGRDPVCKTSGAFFCYDGSGKEAFGSTPDTQTLTCSDPNGIDVTVELTKLSNSEVKLEVSTLGYAMSDVLMKGGQGGANLYEWFDSSDAPRGSRSYADFVTPVNPSGKPADISHILLCLMEEIDECEETNTKVVDVLDMDKWPRGAILRAKAHDEFVPSVVFEIDDEYATLDVSFPFESEGASAVLAHPGSHTLRVQPVILDSKGCYVDQHARMFPVLISLWTAQWTATECVMGCRERGFAYAGSQYYGECWCGTQAQFDAAVKAPDSHCWAKCKGDPTQTCGGGWRNSVYSTAFTPVSDVCELEINVVYNNEPNECAGMIASLALIDTDSDEPVEGMEELALEGNIVEIEKLGGITVRANTEVAPAVQFSIAGNDHYQTDTMYPFTVSSAEQLEDGSWDYQPSAYLALPGTHEIKVRAINIGYQGCFVDLTDSIRIFEHLVGAWNSGLTALQCKVECAQLGYAYAGSQYGWSCYCGTQEEFDDAVVKNYEAAEGLCNRKCVNDETQICGGWGRMSIFETKEDALSDWCTTEVTTVYKEPPACPGIVSGLTLYDAGTAQALHEIADGTNIVLGDTSGMLTIRAHVPEALRKIVKKVRFELDDVVKDDSAFPYYINGDFHIHGGYKFDPEPRLIVPGSHTLKVYTQLVNDEWEMEGRYCAIDFTVDGKDDGPCSGIIQSLALIDAESNGLINPALSGINYVDLASYRGGITVRANTYTTGYQPVKFEVTNLNDELKVTTYDFPHTISETIVSGDQRYNYTGSNIIGVAGKHKIKAAAVMTDYKGCYQDFSARILPVGLGRDWSLPGCIQACRDRGYAYAGLQWYSYCFCGTEDDFNKENNNRRPETECDRDCSKNSFYKCGGSWRNSIYGTDESEITGEWCEAELEASVGDGESSCPGAIGGFSIMIVGGGDVQSLFGFNQINGGQYYVMNMKNFPSALTVRANLVESVEQVRFYVNDVLVMTEFVAPYVLGGKANFTDFIYRADVFRTMGVHEIKAVAVMHGEEVENAESSCSFTLEIDDLPDVPDDPSVPIFDPKTSVDFLLLAEHRCKPLYVDGTAEGNGFFFKTLGEITDTTFDENVTFATSNYFTVDEEVGNLDFMTTVYQDAKTGAIVCDKLSDVPVGATGDEYVGRCDTGNFSYFTVYAWDEHFTAEDDADDSDLPAECKPPVDATIGGGRKFTFAVPCSCSNLDDEIDYGDEIPPGNLVAAAWGDPHIVTWDGTRYDCQAVGEVTLFKAKLLDYGFHFGNEDYETHTIEMQMRFQFMDAYFIRDRLVSLGQGFVVKEKRAIQMIIAEEPEGKPRMGDCGIDFYIDGVRTNFLQGIDEEDLLVHPSGSFLFVFFKKTGFNMRAHVRRDLEGDGSIRTCGISVYAGLPMNNPSIYDVTGMWGTPDGYGANDFLDSSGENVDPPRGWQQHYEFCQANWCNRDESASLFTYENGKSFKDYQRCDVFDWKGDYDFSLVDAESLFICSQLGEHMLVEQCKIDALIGGLNYTKQFYLDVQTMNSMESDATGDSDSACCSKDYKTCFEGDKCNNIYTCDECVGEGTKSVWLHRSLDDDSCSALGGNCYSNDDCCSSGLTSCTDNRCVSNGKDSLRRRRRLEFTGFEGPIVPRDDTHSVAYHTPVYQKYSA